MSKRTCPHLPPGTLYLKLAIADEYDDETAKGKFLSGLTKMPDHIEYDIDSLHKCVEHPLSDSTFWVIAVKEGK